MKKSQGFSKKEGKISLRGLRGLWALTVPPVAPPDSENKNTRNKKVTSGWLEASPVCAEAWAMLRARGFRLGADMAAAVDALRLMGAKREALTFLVHALSVPDVIRLTHQHIKAYARHAGTAADILAKGAPWTVEDIHQLAAQTEEFRKLRENAALGGFHEAVLRYTEIEALTWAALYYNEGYYDIARSEVVVSVLAAGADETARISPHDFITLGLAELKKA